MIFIFLEGLSEGSQMICNRTIGFRQPNIERLYGSVRGLVLLVIVKYPIIEDKILKRIWQQKGRVASEVKCEYVDGCSSECDGG